jgi:predicted kinase
MTDVLARLRCEVGAQRIWPLQRWLAEQREALRTAWRERQRHGAVRECHGDLHGANVVLLDGQLTAFDGLEFDPALRWIDVMSDVAFLTMDLQAHDRADLAYRLLDGWLQHSGDYAGLAVLRCYEVYRALVRALVQALRRRAGQAPPAGAPDYLAWAERHARPADTARLLITHGVSGSGKSTIASALLAQAGAIRVRSDVERKRLFGLTALQPSAAAALDIYTPEATRRTFERLAACARMALLAGWPVIVDAAFLRREERAAFRRLATELRVPFSILHCRAAPTQLQARVAARARAGVDASEATPQVLERQLAGYEPLDAAERACVLDAVTDEAVNVAALYARWLAAGKAA